MDKYPIKIINKIGLIIFYSDRPSPHVGQCVHCKQKIYWVKTMHKKKLLISIHDDETYISHFMVCPTFKNRRRNKKKRSRPPLDK